MRSTMILFCLFAVPLTGLAQSTSQPIPIQSEDSKCVPAEGTCYVDITFKGGSLYQHANWYTNFIGKSKLGNLTITVNSQLETNTVSDTKASDPVTLTKNGNDVSFSYEGPIASLLPLTFSQVSFDVNMNQTVKDGLNDLLTLFAQQSKVSLPLSASTQGYATAGKAIADFLFKPELTQSRALGHFGFTPTTAPKPGYYAVLAGENNADWNRFSSGLKQLPGGGLTSDAGPVTGITYYVYEVTYITHRYETLDGALSFGKSKPWANLYLGAINNSRSGWTLDQHGSLEGDLRKQLEDAQSLLMADVDITGEEKLLIATEATDATNSAYQDRYNKLVLAVDSQNKSPEIKLPNGKTVPANPGVLYPTDELIQNVTNQNKTFGSAGVPGSRPSPRGPGFQTK